MRKKVVLFLPRYSGPPLGPPVGLLCLASPLRADGYDVRILDAAVLRDPAGELSREIAEALCLGVSLLTGPMIRGAVAAAQVARSRRPNLPIVFGGWHPSLLPEQTLRETFVDVVVRHQGEITFREVVRRLNAGESLADVDGCSYKEGDRVRHNPDRPPARLSDLPPPAYDLVNFDLYERAVGERKLPYASSVGCPYACSYCTDTVFYKRRFNAYDSDRVVAEVTRLAALHGIREVSLLDSNFLVDTRRAVEIARGFLSAGASFAWTFQASTDLLCRMSDEEVSLLGRSGVRHIGFGTESASEAVLVTMNKRHQRIPDMFETARKCREAGIRATFNLIFGFPGETGDDRRETLRVMGSIADEYENVTFSPNIFTPYPGIPIWPELRARGVMEPETLEAWADIALGSNLLPWLRGASFESIERSMSYFTLNNEIVKTMRGGSRSRLRRLALQTFRRPLRWRMRNQCFTWPVELWLARAVNGLVLRRSLLTGEGLAEGLLETGS